MSKPLRISIGAEFFRRLREENCYYVDKTALLGELLNDASTASVTLLTRPRRFGKTLTMTMLRDFFDIRQDSKEIFAGLDISRNTALCDAWMNKYPVIFLSLKQIEGMNFPHALGQYADLIGRLCSDNNYLQRSTRVTERDKKILAELEDSSLERRPLENALLTLCHALHDHWDKPVILLIDEYDVPLAKAEENGYYREMVSFLRNMLGAALKSNSSLQFAVLTGCLRISKESIFTGLNNFKCFGIDDVRFADKLGFTSEEVDTLLETANLSEKKTIMQEWYDGYRFGNDKEIYCPWDVLQYVADLQDDLNARPRPYWINSSGNAIVRSFVGRTDLHVGEKFETLIAGGCIEATIIETLTYDALHASEDNLWTLLYLTGYLTKASPELMEQCGLDPNAAQAEDSNKLALVIPNKEVRAIFTSSVAAWFTDTVKSMDRTEFFRCLWTGDAAQLSELLMDQLYATISYYDAHEDYYHAFITGLLSLSDYAVRSNYESGNGRPDILVTDYAHKRAIIIEIKIARNEDGLEAAAQAALEQIEQQKYAEGFPRRIQQVIKYGIAFSKKDCFVLGGISSHASV